MNFISYSLCRFARSVTLSPRLKGGPPGRVTWRFRNMRMAKRLLLGSAAGVVAVGGTQAADLPVKARPVEYVKICTLYGDGFYYIPGSDTCIKFAGYVRADYNFNGRRPHVLAPNGAQDRTIQRSTMRHRARFQIDTRTAT